MEKVTLEVQTRELKAVADALRSQKLIPAVFYGKGEKNIHLQVDYQTFRRLYMNSGSQLIDLVIDGKTNKKALVHDLQFDPLSGKITHIDFLRVSLKEAVTTEVEIEIVGIAPAVKDLGGVLNQIKDVLNIKCLPTDIPKVVQVDISGLTEFNSAIHVKDVVVPKEVTVLDVPDDVVVIINAPRVEEEEAPVAAEVAGEEAATPEAGAEPAAEEKKEE
jgi:large subunit ribosomal protein L25